MIGDILWEPPADLRQSTEVGRFMGWLRDRRGHDFSSYQQLWRWSVEDQEGFWGSIWDFYEIRAHTPYERVLGSSTPEGAAVYEPAISAAEAAERLRRFEAAVARMLAAGGPSRP